MSEYIYDAVGIQPFFINEHGEKTYPTDEIKQKVLACFEEKTPYHFNKEALPSVVVFYHHETAKIDLFKENPYHNYIGHWQLILEGGEVLEGYVSDCAIHLPQDLPLGYHDLHLTLDHIYQLHCRIIVAPKQCYLPERIKNKEKLWGSCVQLYTLRSENNWGIGDFGDLQSFLTQFQAFGGDFIGLNPTHALFPANPEGASPYSPSSRRWLNILYIDVAQLPWFQQSKEAQTWFKSKQTLATLNKVRSQDWIDYSAVTALKLTGLQLAFDYFETQSDGQEAFEQFLQEGGESLQVQATFDALHAHLSAQKSEQWGWNHWDECYQDYHSEAVSAFRQEYASKVRFYAWLQWCASQQLAACYDICEQKAMTIGLYRDLAVGVADNGAETWVNRDLFSLKASVGAPPDVLGPQGQNWGLAPWNPHILKKQGYQPFIEMVQANMRSCGGLRIDHIMGLLRLWWIERGDSAKNGAYVTYPVDDLIAILALESQRHQCLVIGEDLGTVPQEIVSKLKDAAIFSYKIFYFEFDEKGESLALDQYPYQAMTTLSTHDLPTINGYWRGYDFELGEKYDVYPNPDILAVLKTDRINAKAKILKRLQVSLNKKLPKSVNESLTSGCPLSFNHDLQRYVAQVNSGLFGLQPEDWLGMTEPVNIPGTSTEYKNWRRKLTHNIDEIFANKNVQALLKGITKIRQSS